MKKIVQKQFPTPRCDSTAKYRIVRPVSSIRSIRGFTEWTLRDEVTLCVLDYFLV